MRGKKAKEIRRKFRMAGINISSMGYINSSGRIQVSSGRRKYQLVKKGLAVIE